MVLSFIKDAIASAEGSDVEKIKFSKFDGKEIIADLHIHSRFSRATSKNTTIPLLVKSARVKGIDILGTGDISHEKWLSEIKQNLKERGNSGIYTYKDDAGEFMFVLSGEISLVFTSQGKGRRVHLVYLAPSLEVNDRINKYLDSLGRRDYDGRPIFSVSCEEFVKQLKLISDKIEIIPAHIWTLRSGWCLWGTRLTWMAQAYRQGRSLKRLTAPEPWCCWMRPNRPRTARST